MSPNKHEVFVPGRMIAGAIAAAVLSGCSTMMPYDSDFSCKNEDHGQCIHPEDAYAAAVQEAGDAPALAPAETGGGSEPRMDGVPYQGYRAAVHRELAGLIASPVTPMLRPATTVRTLILPYSDPKAGDRIYMPRFVYSVLDGPKFVLGDYLVGDDSDIASIIAQGALPARRIDASAEGDQ